MHYAFFGPLIGALARSAGGALSDRWGDACYAGELHPDGYF
jgi:nitrate/nitrite transporter NarK